LLIFVSGASEGVGQVRRQLWQLQPSKRDWTEAGAADAGQALQAPQPLEELKDAARADGISFSRHLYTELSVKWKKNASTKNIFTNIYKHDVVC
jgi:hypothetical protein